MCTVFPTNKTTHAIHPNETNCPHTIYPNDANRPCVIHPNENVGAAPMCPPERPHSGVSMPKTHALCVGANDGCAFAGRHGRAHRHRPYPSPPNRTVCPYPIGVILSIAQGWQVQRSLPWVTMQARRLPTTWVVLFPPHCFFMPSPHTHRGRKCIAHSRPHS